MNSSTVIVPLHNNDEGKSFFDAIYQFLFEENKSEINIDYTTNIFGHLNYYVTMMILVVFIINAVILVFKPLKYYFEKCFIENRNRL